MNPQPNTMWYPPSLPGGNAGECAVWGNWQGQPAWIGISNVSGQPVNVSYGGPNSLVIANYQTGLTSGYEALVALGYRFRLISNAYGDIGNPQPVPGAPQPAISPYGSAPNYGSAQSWSAPVAPQQGVNTALLLGMLQSQQVTAALAQANTLINATAITDEVTAAAVTGNWLAAVGPLFGAQANPAASSVAPLVAVMMQMLGTNTVVGLSALFSSTGEKLIVAGAGDLADVAKEVGTFYGSLVTQLSLQQNNAMLAAIAGNQQLGTGALIGVMFSTQSSTALSAAITAARAKLDAVGVGDEADFISAVQAANAAIAAFFASLQQAALFQALAA